MNDKPRKKNRALERAEKLGKEISERLWRKQTTSGRKPLLGRTGPRLPEGDQDMNERADHD